MPTRAAAREQPRLWLVRNQDDPFWMDWHRAKGHVERFETVTDWTTLFDRFRGAVKGAVIPDEKLFRGDLLAVNVAACEDLIVTSPQLAERLGLPVKVDLRGRFPTYAEGLQWLWANYKDRFNPHLCDFRHPGLLPHGTFDYGYQWRALMFWVAGPKEEDKPGVDRVAEHRLVAKILSEMPVNGVCVGFPAMGEGEGMGEPPGVELLSRYGKSLVCNNHGGNYSILSGVRIDRLDPPKAPPPPALERDKVYIALALSDGDNQILWPAFFRRYFEHPAFGKFPLAFGMGPAIRELQPGLAQWYFEHATPTTEFFADVSGAGYMQPDHFAEAYVRSRARVDRLPEVDSAPDGAAGPAHHSHRGRQRRERDALRRRLAVLPQHLRRHGPLLRPQRHRELDVLAAQRPARVPRRHQLAVRQGRLPPRNPRASRQSTPRLRQRLRPLLDVHDGRLGAYPRATRPRYDLRHAVATRPTVPRGADEEAGNKVGWVST